MVVWLNGLRVGQVGLSASKAAPKSFMVDHHCPCYSILGLSRPLYIYISPQFPFIFANFWEPSTFLSSTFLCQSQASMLPKARPPDASVVTQRTSPAADGRDHLTNCKNPKTHQHHRHRPHQTRGTPQDFRPSARNCADSTMWPFTKLKASGFHEFSEAPHHFALSRFLQIRISMDIYHQPDGWYITVFTGRCLQSSFSICLANLRVSPRLCHDLGS